eukprot:16420696-Heterocapsa_arctica.AAC.1
MDPKWMSFSSQKLSVKLKSSLVPCEMLFSTAKVATQSFSVNCWVASLRRAGVARLAPIVGGERGDSIEPILPLRGSA